MKVDLMVNVSMLLAVFFINTVATEVVLKRKMDYQPLIDPKGVCHLIKFERDLGGSKARLIYRMLPVFDQTVLLTVKNYDFLTIIEEPLVNLEGEIYIPIPLPPKPTEFWVCFQVIVKTGITGRNQPIAWEVQTIF